MTDVREDRRNPLEGWVVGEFAAAGLSRPVYRRGSGPGVVLIPELPGMTPEVMDLGNRMVAEGFTVVVPSLVGTPGRAATIGYSLREVAKVCVSREFGAMALDAERPVAAYLRALAGTVHEEVGGPGVGVIGMCFSGGFALAAAVDPSVRASVVSQPSVPFPLSPARRRDPGLSAGELRAVRGRADAGEVCVLAMRFTRDRLSPGERFATLRAALGPGFEVFEIDSAPGNAHGIPTAAHSVLTVHRVERPGHPTVDAHLRMVDFLRTRLTPAAGPAT